MAEQSASKDEAKTPFTIITGFLGAGKTTLINYILTEQRDKRICVIENEFGEINIDEKLVSANMASKEDLIQMDNGCACCSIRGDLVRTLGGLVEKRQQFDAVMLETTGLADPAPIIATLKSNQWIDDNFAIDAVVCRCRTSSFTSIRVVSGSLGGRGRVWASQRLFSTQVVCLASAKHVKAHLEEQKPDGAWRRPCLGSRRRRRRGRRDATHSRRWRGARNAATAPTPSMPRAAESPSPWRWTCDSRTPSTRDSTRRARP